MQKFGFIFTQAYWESDHGPHIGDEDIPGTESLSKLPKVARLVRDITEANPSHPDLKCQA